MADIIVIGGPSRAGKTTLAARLLSRPEFSGFDTLRWDAFKLTMSESFGVSKADFYTHEQLCEDTPEKEAERDLIVFNAMKPYILWEINEGHDLLLEGRFRPGFDWSFLDAAAPPDSGEIKLIEIYLLRSPGSIADEAKLLRFIDESSSSGGWIADAGWGWEEFATHHVAGVRAMISEAETAGKPFYNAAAYPGDSAFPDMLDDAVTYALFETWHASSDKRAS